MATQITPRENGHPTNRPVVNAMKSEMDRVFDRFHHGWPSFSHLLSTSDADVLLPTLDLKDTGKAISSKPNCRASTKRT